jgi:hypothetical protein
MEEDSVIRKAPIYRGFFCPQYNQFGFLAGPTFIEQGRYQ